MNYAPEGSDFLGLAFLQGLVVKTIFELVPDIIGYK
jgi:hypothetical protein